MALRGNLKDFSLPDVFQLITFSKKTGVLRIKRADGVHGSVWFRDGEVFFAQSNWHAELLGERLVRAERITPAALARALEVRGVEGEDRRLGTILVDEGYITENVLEGFVQSQIQDTIFDLMRWDEGDFDFEVLPEIADEDIGLSVSIENVIMEGSRRLEEWNRIKKKVPSMDIVFKMATAPGEGTFEISLKPIEWNLLLLVDGTRSVAELAVETGRTDFEVARIIYGLYSAGLLEFATDEEVARLRAERAEREAAAAQASAAKEAERAAQATAALEREAALNAQAEARMRAEADAAVAVSEPEPAGQAQAAILEHHEPAEVPEFLGGAVQQAPTADDQAVLEQLLGVLGVDAASAPAPVAASEPVEIAEPAVAKMEAPAEPATEAAVSHEYAAEVEAVEPEPPAAIEPEPAEEPQELGAEQEPEPFVPATEPSVPEPFEFDLASLGLDQGSLAEEVEEPAEDSGDEPELVLPEAGGDFERDLLALGLGELPSDLLEPITPEPAAPAPAGTAAFDELDFLVAEPMSQVGEAALTAQPLAAEPPADAPSMGIDESAMAFEQTLGEPEELGSDAYPAPSEDAQDAVSQEPDHLLPAPSAEAPDLSALLESLEAEGPSSEESGFDEELLADSGPTGGVISTDAFLDEISFEGMGLSGGLGDELSALTGAQTTPKRPTASVNKIPEPGEEILHRDQSLDRDTLLKIIDGIKKL